MEPSEKDFRFRSHRESHPIARWLSIMFDSGRQDPNGFASRLAMDQSLGDGRVAWQRTSRSAMDQSLGDGLGGRWDPRLSQLSKPLRRGPSGSKWLSRAEIPANQNRILRQVAKAIERHENSGKRSPWGSEGCAFATVNVGKRSDLSVETAGSMNCLLAISAIATKFGRWFRCAGRNS